MACDSGFWSMTVGDLATWVGGIASAAAAFAAWYAAQKAVELAQLPMRQAKDDRMRTARTFAPAIAEEMGEVSDAARDVEDGIEAVFRTGLGNGRAYLGRVSINPMLATSRCVPFIACFETAEAAEIIRVISASGHFLDMVGRLGRISEKMPDYDMERISAIANVKAAAEALRTSAGRAYVAMNMYIPA